MPRRSGTGSWRCVTAFSTAGMWNVSWIARVPARNTRTATADRRIAFTSNGTLSPSNSPSRSWLKPSTRPPLLLVFVGLRRERLVRFLVVEPLHVGEARDPVALVHPVPEVGPFAAR